MQPVCVEVQLHREGQMALLHKPFFLLLRLKFNFLTFQHSSNALRRHIAAPHKSLSRLLCLSQSRLPHQRLRKFQSNSINLPSAKNVPFFKLFSAHKKVSGPFCKRPCFSFALKSRRTCQSPVINLPLFVQSALYLPELAVWEP